MAMNIKYWLSALYHHYTETPEKVFPRFKLGAMIFFLGLVIFYGAVNLLQESLLQELVVLVSLITVGIGFIIAMMAHIRFIIGRILKIFSK